MKDFISSDHLARLGLTGEMSPVERLALPASPVAEALSFRESIIGLTMLSSLMAAGRVSWQHVPSGSAEAAGAWVDVVEGDSRYYRIRSQERATEIEVLEPTSAPSGFLPVTGDPGAVLWDSSSAPSLVVRVSGDRALILVSEPDGPRAAAMLTVRPIEALASPTAPLEEWMALCSDRWLVDQLQSHADVGGAWNHAVAAGLIARVSEPGEEAVARVERILRGETDEQYSKPRRWVRGLDDRELRTIEDLALAEAEAVRFELEEVQRELGPSAGEWTAEWVDASHRRDDLEGVFLLLREAGRGERLGSAIARLDRLGRRLLFNLPAGTIKADERMRRAVLSNPDAWWGNPDIKGLL